MSPASEPGASVARGSESNDTNQNLAPSTQQYGTNPEAGSIIDEDNESDPIEPSVESYNDNYDEDV